MPISATCFPMVHVRPACAIASTRRLWISKRRSKTGRQLSVFFFRGSCKNTTKAKGTGSRPVPFSYRSLNRRLTHSIPKNLCLACGRSERLRTSARARRGRHRFRCFGGFHLILLLPVLLILRRLLLLFGVANFDSTLEDGAFFHADAVCNHVAGEQAFIADIEAIGALDVALNLAHDDDFLGHDVGGNVAVAADSDSILWKANSAFDAAIDE